MKKTLYPIIVSIAISATPAYPENIPFPSGTFEGGTTGNWTSSTSGVASTSFPFDGSNTVARIAPTTGSGSLRATVPAVFQPDSLYEVSFDFSASSLLAAGSGYAIEIRDGSDQVVASLSNEELVGLLGLDLAPANDLTLDLNGLAGALTDQDALLATLRDLLGSLDSNGALLAEIQALVADLAGTGADSDLIAALVALLDDVLSGDLDPGNLDDTLIADLLGLDVLDPVVEEVSDLIAALAGNEDPVAALSELLAAILGNPGDLALVNELITTLLGEPGLLGEVTNLLNLSLVEDVLGGLTNGETLGLLGLLDPSAGGTQTAKLYFTTDATAPVGNPDVVLNGEATLGLLSFDYDNIALRRFDLAPTPVIVTGTVRPVVAPQRQRVIRRTSAPSVTIKGTATAFGRNNTIRKVEVSLRGSGVPASARLFKPVKGRESWTARVRVPVSPRTRVLFRAEDAAGLRSLNELVRVSRS